MDGLYSFRQFAKRGRVICSATRSVQSLTLRLPAKCPECLAVGTVKPETTVRGIVAVLAWCCSACGHDWPIKPEEQQPERRQAPAERRRIVRGDRRKS